MSKRFIRLFLKFHFLKASMTGEMFLLNINRFSLYLFCCQTIQGLLLKLMSVFYILIQQQKQEQWMRCHHRSPCNLSPIEFMFLTESDFIKEDMKEKKKTWGKGIT